MSFIQKTILPLLLILVLSIFLRLAVLDNIFCDPALGSVAYSCGEIDEGGKLYANTVENKFPGSYLLFNALFSFFDRDMTYVYKASIVMHVLVLLCLYLLGRMTMGNQAGLLTSFLYALYSATHYINGICPNFETWTLLPVALGFVFLWFHGNAHKGRWSFFAGICFGLAMLFRQNTVLMFFSGILYLYMDQPDKAPRNAVLNPLPKDMLLIFSGFFLPLVAVFAWLITKGDFLNFIKATNPFASWMGARSEPLVNVIGAMIANGTFFILDHKFLFFLACGYVVLVLNSNWTTKASQKVIRGFLIIGAWLLGSALAVLAGTNFFGHHFVLLIPPLALAAGFSVTYARMYSSLPKLFGILLLVLAIVGGSWDLRKEARVNARAFGDLYRYERLEFAGSDDNFWQKNDVNRYSDFSHHMEKIGKCIQANTDPGDRIFVWDYEPGVYWYADRKSPTRHYKNFFITGNLPAGSENWSTTTDPKIKAAREELMTDLSKTFPAYIVVFTPPPDSETDHGFYHVPAQMFLDLKLFVSENYIKDPGCSGKYLTALKWKNFVAAVKK